MAVFFGIELGVRIKWEIAISGEISSIPTNPNHAPPHRHQKLDNQNTGQISSELIYTIHRDNHDQLQIRRHGLQIGKEPTIVMLE